MKLFAAILIASLAAASVVAYPSKCFCIYHFNFYTFCLLVLCIIYNFISREIYFKCFLSSEFLETTVESKIWRFYGRHKQIQ